MKPRFPDENALWAFLQPKLRGTWWRLEAVTPDGLPDSMGLWKGRTWWCELKVGPPSLTAVRPAQRGFCYTCVDRGVEHWTCFGHKGRPRFFMNLDLTVEAEPPFYRT